MRRFLAKNEKNVGKNDLVILKKPPAEEEYEVTKYNSNGITIDSLSDEDCCIIVFKNKTNNRNIFKVQCTKIGKLYNPLNKSIKYHLAAKDNISNKMFKFREVNYNSYVNYLKFLQNRNNSNLIIAEREMR